MIVSVELFGIHRQIASADRIELSLRGKTLVSDVLASIREKYPAISLEEHSILVTVNHEIAKLNRPLRANDTVCILPHIGGG